MTWECDVCGRTFAHRNQLHSCSSFDIEYAFSGSGKRWMPLYLRLLGMAKERLPPFTEHFPSIGVTWRHTSTFAEFRYTKKEFSAFFFADSLKMERGPVRHLQTSANRTIHQVTITDSNIEEVMGWIAESYILTRRED